MDRHSRAVNGVASAVRMFSELDQPFRVWHGTSHSTRPRHGPNQNIVDISMLSNVLKVDTERRVAYVEPNVPMDRLVEVTLAHGLVPPVVMEFPGITVGGGFSGTSGESSSFRHGFFSDTVISVEMVLGNGSIVQASNQERQDLFHGAAGAAGTLGIITLAEVRLVEARKLVKTTYRRVSSSSLAVSELQKQTENEDIDYIDGIAFSPDHSVIVTGQLVDTKPVNCRLQTFSQAHDPWFYMHVENQTRHLSSSSIIVEYIPLTEYLFRYDRGGFWVGRQGYTYFGVVPFTKFFRWLLDDYSHTRTLYHALHASGISSQFVVQDLALPYDKADEFMSWVSKELAIWPLWLCPLRGCSMPTFHPVSKSQFKEGLVDEKNTSSDVTNMSQDMLNVGVWGWGPRDHDTFVAKNRALEDKLRQLGGRKWLYSHTYYTEEEFWSEYDRPWYQALRKKYFVTGLPTVYDKVKSKLRVERDVPKQRSDSWLSTWPIGGLYGMMLATFSGDISLHRNAKWRYNAE